MSVLQVLNKSRCQCPASHLANLLFLLPPLVVRGRRRKQQKKEKGECQWDDRESKIIIGRFTSHWLGILSDNGHCFYVRTVVAFIIRRGQSPSSHDPPAESWESGQQPVVDSLSLPPPRHLGCTLSVWVYHSKPSRGTCLHAYACASWDDGSLMNFNGASSVDSSREVLCRHLEARTCSPG